MNLVDMAHVRRALELYRSEFFQRLLPDGYLSLGGVHAQLYVFLAGFRCETEYAAEVAREITERIGLAGEPAQDFQKGFRLTVERMMECYRRTA